MTFNAAGKIETSVKIGSLRLDDDVTDADYLRGCLEYLTLLLAVAHTVRELAEMHKYRYGYFVFWNCLDLARQAVLYAGFVQYYILQHHDLRENLTLPVPESTYVNFEALVKLEMDYSSLAAINILLSTGMIFKFLVPFPKLGVFVHTM